jgi:hypothetical protein
LPAPPLPRAGVPEAFQASPRRSSSRSQRNRSGAPQVPPPHDARDSGPRLRHKVVMTTNPNAFRKFRPRDQVVRRKTAFWSGLSPGGAPENSPGREPWVASPSATKPRRGGRGQCRNFGASFLSPLPGLSSVRPRSHGWRRGLFSFASPRLVDHEDLRIPGTH